MDRFSTRAPLPSSQGTVAHNSAADDPTMKRMTIRVSGFDVSQMPVESIEKRELHSYSVHYSQATNKYIATIPRPSPSAVPGEKAYVRSFPFDKEHDAKKFAKFYSPPKMMTKSKTCRVCSVPLGIKCLAVNCKNCGQQICDKCSVRWGIRMVPKTYLANPYNSSLTVRVCSSCNWLNNAFCMALLQGNYESALQIQTTGNVNLRCTFADINKEAMFPIHCAVMGGNLELVTWLVETHGCPLSNKRDPKSGGLLSIQTSKSRTLIDLAMSGKPKLEVLSYLVKRNLSVLDTKDPMLAPKTLQLLLGAGFRFEKPEEGSCARSFAVESSERSVASLEDACMICCERQMDVVLVPCGHQCCCSTCSEKLSTCPICKRNCSVLRIFRL